MELARRGNLWTGETRSTTGWGKTESGGEILRTPQISREVDAQFSEKQKSREGMRTRASVTGRVSAPWRRRALGN